MAKKAASKGRAAGKWKASPPALIAAFAEALAGLPAESIEHRKMFGYPCAFVNGNLCCGLHEGNGIVRVGEAERETAVSRLGAGYFEPGGRRMREYVSLPPEITGDPCRFRRWVNKAFAYTAGLPPKRKE